MSRCTGIIISANVIFLYSTQDLDHQNSILILTGENRGQEAR